MQGNYFCCVFLLCGDINLQSRCVCRDDSLARITFKVFFFHSHRPKGSPSSVWLFVGVICGCCCAFVTISRAHCSGATKEQDLPGARLLEAFAGFDRGHQSLYLRSEGFPALRKVHQQGKGRGKRAKDRARQAATLGLSTAGHGSKRNGRAAWRIALPKFSRPCCPTSLQRIKSVSLADRPNRGKKGMGSKDRKCLLTYVSRATCELNWVHGEFTRTPAHVSSRAAPE